MKSDVKAERFGFRFKHINGDMYRRGNVLYIRFIDLFGEVRFMKIGYVHCSNKNKK